ADIMVFQRLRRMKQWWPAPTASSIFGNLLDTYAFFAIAFYHTNDAFMAEHWIGIGFVDYLVKITANLMIFLPVYGVLLNFLIKKIEDK
ncbi:queuosine precursor transporter, partial [Holdemanella porci]|uniref:queuosine precursor transporter n=1 Tax=Holdemanella porci TaxID=2652276 RepID=UPI002FDEC34F